MAYDPHIYLYPTTLHSICAGNLYPTTLHTISAALSKLSLLTKKTKVYRGINGGMLPSSFLEEDQYCVRSGVEFAFMSTTTNREVAIHYAR